MNAMMFLLCCGHFFQINKEKLQGPLINLPEQTLLIAHRGLTSMHLENTLDALTAAFVAGADGVEFDVQMTKDMVPMVFHDQDLSRLTDKEGHINDFYYEEIKNLAQTKHRYQQSYKIPTLGEVMSALPDHKLINVELKETTLLFGAQGIEKILSELRPHRDRLNIIISSFDPDILYAVAEADADYRLGLLIDKEDTFKAYLKARKIINRVHYLHPHIDLVNKHVSYLIKKMGIGLLFWGHQSLGQEDNFISHEHRGLISDDLSKLIQKYARAPR